MRSPISKALLQGNARKSSNGAAEIRDAFKDMMLENDPDFGSFTEKEILDGYEVTQDDGSTFPGKHRCVTQKVGTIKSLYIGLQHGEVYLWKNGSILNWTARKDGYPSHEDALLAARGVYTATKAWEKLLGGRVQFKYTSIFNDACFQVLYGGENGNVLASAFFPDDYRDILNELYVYQLQFEPEHKDTIANTMAHEIGHVLGLRHEFAEAEDLKYNVESIFYGIRNPDSVMANTQIPKIQPSDVKYTNEIYDKLHDGKVLTGTINNVTITKTVFRVSPDN